ncbi:MAG TPA: hypothetical protein VH143_03405 [Kofleriaceae bacterium]|jgi:hypothetical protein|nr:hypothetical protein [Kofleriaceae bacterium]
MRAALLVVVMIAGAAVAAPVDPRALPVLAADTKLAPAGARSGAKPADDDAIAIASAGADADLVLFALGTGDFVAIAGAHPLDARLDASLPAAFDALVQAAGAVRLAHGTAGAVELERYDAPALELMRELADAAGASYVLAPGHALPALTIRAHRANARDVMRAVASLLRLELIEDHGVWIVAEPHTKLDPVIAAHVHAGSRLEINRAHPGEARRLLEPDETQDRNTCPADTWVEASLHGEVGVLEAVLDTLGGPSCEQHPDVGQLDTGAASLVGILVEPHQRRAVFRVRGGARVFEPNRGERVEINYVVIAPGGPAIHPSITTANAGDATGPLADDLVLRATLHIGRRWAALLRSPGGEWRIARPPGFEISAASVTAGEQTFSLEH